MWNTKEQQFEELPSLRPYQERCVEAARQRNSLVVLPTNAGKTRIAASLLEATLREIASSYASGAEVRQKCAFLVPTGTLAEQQALALLKSCKELRPDPQSRLQEWAKPYYFRPAGFVLGVARGGQNRNLSKLLWRTCDIVVATPEMLLSSMIQGFIRLEHLKLLILDEAHNLRGDASYAIIMRFFYQDCEQKPRVLALTASPVDGRKEKSKTWQLASEAQIRQELLDIERKLDCHLWTDLDVHRQSKTCREVDVEVPAVSDTNSCDNLVLLIERALDQVVTAQSSPDIVEKTRAKWREYIDSMRAIRSSLGTKCARQMLQLFSESSENKGSCCILEDSDTAPQGQEAALDAAWSLKQRAKQNLAKTLGESHYSEEHLETLPNFRSEKLIALERELVRRMEGDFDGEECKVIIFTKMRVVCRSLAYYLQQLPALANRKVSCVTSPGSSGGLVIGTNTVATQRDAIQGFKKNEISILVATAVICEGIDVSDCNLVIRFDLSATPLEHAQSRGRARAKMSELMCLVTPEEKTLVQEFRLSEDRLAEVMETWEDLKHKKDAAGRRESREPEPIEPWMVLDVPETGARLPLERAKNHLHGLVYQNFNVNRVQGQQASMLTEDNLFRVEFHSSGTFSCTLRLPYFVNTVMPLEQQKQLMQEANFKEQVCRPIPGYLCEVYSHAFLKKDEAKKSAALEACRILRRICLLDTHLRALGDDPDAPLQLVEESSSSPSPTTLVESSGSLFQSQSQMGQSQSQTSCSQSHSQSQALSDVARSPSDSCLPAPLYPPGLENVVPMVPQFVESVVVDKTLTRLPSQQGADQDAEQKDRRAAAKTLALFAKQAAKAAAAAVRRATAKAIPKQTAKADDPKTVPSDADKESEEEEDNSNNKKEPEERNKGENKQEREEEKNEAAEQKGEAAKKEAPQDDGDDDGDDAAYVSANEEEEEDDERKNDNKEQEQGDVQVSQEAAARVAAVPTPLKSEGVREDREGVFEHVQISLSDKVEGIVRDLPHCLRKHLEPEYPRRFVLHRICVENHEGSHGIGLLLPQGVPDNHVSFQLSLEGSTMAQTWVYPTNHSGEAVDFDDNQMQLLVQWSQLALDIANLTLLCPLHPVFGSTGMLRLHERGAFKLEGTPPKEEELEPGCWLLAPLGEHDDLGIDWDFLAASLSVFSTTAATAAELEEEQKICHWPTMDRWDLPLPMRLPVSDCVVVAEYILKGTNWRYGVFVRLTQEDAGGERKLVGHRLSRSKKAVVNEIEETATELQFEKCEILPLASGHFRLLRRLPQVLWRLEFVAKLRELRMEHFDVLGALGDNCLGEAYSHGSVSNGPPFVPGTQDNFNYEQLEFFGDAVLKLLSVLHTMDMLPNADEGRLSKHSQDWQRNDYLRVTSLQFGLERYLLSQSYSPTATLTGLRQKNISSKAIADIVESTLGAVTRTEYLRTRSFSDALRAGWHCFSHFILTADHQGRTSFDGLWKYLPPAGPEIRGAQIRNMRDAIEAAFGYRFQSEKLLISLGPQVKYRHDRQRLEFLGDAVLQPLCSWHIMQHVKTFDEGILSDIRHGYVCNRHLGRRLLRRATKSAIGFLHFFLEGTQLAQAKAMQKWVLDSPQTEDFSFGADQSRVNKVGSECKFVADLYETLVGAILLDSHGDFDHVWELVQSDFSQDIADVEVKLCIWRSQQSDEGRNKTMSLQGAASPLPPLLPSLRSQSQSQQSQQSLPVRSLTSTSLSPNVEAISISSCINSSSNNNVSAMAATASNSELAAGGQSVQTPPLQALFHLMEEFASRPLGDESFSLRMAVDFAGGTQTAALKVGGQQYIATCPLSVSRAEALNAVAEQAAAEYISPERKALKEEELAVRQQQLQQQQMQELQELQQQQQQMLLEQQRQQQQQQLNQLNQLQQQALQAGGATVINVSTANSGDPKAYLQQELQKRGCSTTASYSTKGLPDGHFQCTVMVAGEAHVGLTVTTQEEAERQGAWKALTTIAGRDDFKPKSRLNEAFSKKFLHTPTTADLIYIDGIGWTSLKAPGIRSEPFYSYIPRAKKKERENDVALMAYYYMETCFRKLQ